MYRKDFMLTVGMAVLVVAIVVVFVRLHRMEQQVCAFANCPELPAVGGGGTGGTGPLQLLRRSIAAPAASLSGALQKADLVARECQEEDNQECGEEVDQECNSGAGEIEELVVLSPQPTPNAESASHLDPQLPAAAENALPENTLPENTAPRKPLSMPILAGPTILPQVPRQVTAGSGVTILDAAPALFAFADAGALSR